MFLTKLTSILAAAYLQLQRNGYATTHKQTSFIKNCVPEGKEIVKKVTETTDYTLHISICSMRIKTEWKYLRWENHDKYYVHNYQFSTRP
jgi:hypothetical protein